MKCENCDADMDKKWSFCSVCGFKIAKTKIFEDIFSRIKKEFFSPKEYNQLEKDVEARDISPFFKKPNGGGFSIKIYRSGGKQPQVQVKTFGGINKERIENAVYNQLGMKETGVENIRNRAKEIQKEEKRDNIRSGILKSAEEPKTKIKSLGNRVVVDIELPGVKSIGEVRINELENSVEVKAIIGDKAFFKILTKPTQFRLADKTFAKEVLHLEFA